ncbi:DUF1722 domain-containing protein [Kurthia sibirica]|uniref:Type II DNA modification enzyme n=1 Tax=Kurthia sibirica TaxID=202750 RepID=A0A2U3AJM2_9BACL|nr:DUF1722 domain-containing protein [Kurthia sibirica]PWI24749.1 type II DNA modification enzyme [Kurthia sibirica]GEK35116.1 hypothetical protein KSI01_26490 [Kurthia sibirica]
MTQQRDMQQLWASEKYRVMYVHQNSYNTIRHFMAQPDGTLQQLQQLLDNALKQQPSRGSAINTFDHIWGYFKKYATPKEKEHAQQLRNHFQNADELWSFLAKLAVHYEVPYLKNSTLLLPYL